MNTVSAASDRTDHKLRLLEQLLEEAGVGGASDRQIRRRRNPQEYPLSFVQQRLWMLDRIEPGYHYNDHFNLRLRGELEINSLARSLNEIVRRHEALRARFQEYDGGPTQTIAPIEEVALPVTDIGSLREEERERRLTQLAVEAVRQPFDLQRGPMLRAQLVKLGIRDHVLILLVHHIAIDGWSRGVFLRELAQLYPAFLAGQESPLAELPIQYADFAAWQREFVQGERLGSHLTYWKRELAGAPALLEWPTDQPRPANQSFRGARKELCIPAGTTAGLRELGQREGCTLFMTLLAGFQVLASRYTGREDIVVASPIANRNRAEVEGLIGCFLNTLVLRTDTSGDPAFMELLGRVKEKALGAYAHQDLPYERLVEELHPPRDQSYNPIFQTMFILQNAPRPVHAAGGLEIAPFEMDSGTSKFDLTVNLVETEGRLEGWIEYATDLFEPDTIERLSGHYRTLLAGITADPGARISRLPLLGTEERERLISEWNNTRSEYPRNTCIHELVERQAQETPEAIAVECGEVRWSYRELNERAAGLAQVLRNAGAGPGMLVGICVGRSAGMVAGLLGILKTGASYLPLDPLLPKERLCFILGDAEVALLVTDSKFKEELSSVIAAEASKVAVICLDEIDLRDREIREDCEKPGVTAEGRAYVIYTSGSTGQPKGVQISHAAVVNFLHAMRREPGLTARDSLLAVTTLSFDIAGLEIWLPLTAGARVVIARTEETRDGGSLAKLLSESGATVMQATPTTWRMLLEAGWKGSPKIKILCGGEAWPDELARALRGRCGSLWNMYGPTETTIWSAVDEVSEHGKVLIGKPIANTRFHVLDRNLQPVPVGVPGELFIGGDGLALGYLDRPQLTAERFVTDPFTPEPGARMYRTGDLVRYRTDGRIEFLGRLDHQVKIRGFRIELGEIESVLSRHAGVREAVVLAREDVPGEKRLVGYIVPKAGVKPDLGEIREFLKQRLPDYMIPAAFVIRESFPLTGSGKIDRKAMPAPDLCEVSAASDYVAPRTSTEMMLAEIWSKALQRERVGTQDNFFDIGGHSLLLMQVQSRLSRALGREIPTVKLFQYPTIASLARFLDEPVERAAGSPQLEKRARMQRAAWARPAGSGRRL